MERGFEPSEADQNKITNLITSFARSEAGLLKYSEVVMLMLDRCMLNNKLTLTSVQRLFEEALNVKAIRPADKVQIQGERYLAREQIVYLFQQAAKVLYRPDPHYLQRFYNTFVSERSSGENGEINRARVMLFDEGTKKLLFEDGVLCLREYQQELTNLFVCYMQQNYSSQKKNGRLLLSLREIMLQNKRWSYLSLLFFLKQSQTVPHLMTVQHIEETLRLLIPNVNSREQQFYSRHTFAQAYHRDNENVEQYHIGDPGMYYFELQLLILKIASDSYPRELEKQSLGGMLQRYLKYIYLRRDIHRVQFANVNKKLVLKLREYYRRVQVREDTGAVREVSEADEKDGYRRVGQILHAQLSTAMEVKQIAGMLKVIDKELPKIPARPVVVPEARGPYNKADAITLGVQPPPEPVEVVEKAGKVEKKEKEEGEPARVFKWGEVPVAKFAAEDKLKDIQSKLAFEVMPLGDMSRGVIQKEGYPCLIAEKIFPNQLPKRVMPYIQAARNALLECNFVLALQNYQKGIKAWKESAVQFDSVTQIYFQYSKGSVYLSAGRPDLALQIFFLLRKHGETSRVAFANPDRSLPYYGIGQALYEMEEFELAARSFLRAREIREGVLGLQHVQTACVFNNLGCCFYMLQRPQEALAYVEIAEVVLDTELGALHERTATARANLKKVAHGHFVYQPAYRKFWEVFEEDKFQKKKKKKEKEEKKK